MPSTPRFHRRKHSRGNSSPSAWLSHLKSKTTPTRSTPPRNNDNSPIDEEAANLESLQQPVLKAPGPSVLSGTVLGTRKILRQSNRESPPRPPLPPAVIPAPDPPPTSLSAAPSWTENPEQLFFSQDDDSITVCESGDDLSSEASSANDNETSYFSSYGNFPLFPESEPPPTVGAADDETCNNTLTEIKKQRSKKAVRASTVGAFNTFLKALFGIGMLSNPAVLGEVGLLLGTICHLFIILGCAFACYLLLTARQLAVNEVRAREKKEQEDIDEYNEFVRRRKAMLENSVVQQHQVIEQRQKELKQQQQQQSEDLLQPLGSPLRPPMISSVTASTPDGWGRCQDSMIRAGEVLSPASNCTEACTGGEPDLPPPPMLGDIQDSVPQTSTWAESCTGELPPPPLIDDYEEYNGKPAETVPKFSDPMNGFSGPISPISVDSKRSHRRNISKVTDDYRRLEDMHRHESMASLTSLTQPPKKSKPVRLVTYGDVAKYLAGPTFAQLMIFTIVSVHLMFASGMLHIAVENLCYIAGWDRLGFSYTDVMYTGADDFYGNNYYGSMRRQLGSGSRDQHSGSRSGDHNSRDEHHSRDQVVWQEIDMEEAEEEYAKWEGPDFVGRLAMSSLLFPIIHGLLQIPSLKELATISTIGLSMYALGCIGSMMYSAFVLTEGQPFLDRPDDIFQIKWSGIPTYVATTIYAIEGINLALPTVNTLEGSERGGRVGGLWKKKGVKGEAAGKGGDNSIKLVVTAVFCYGCVTLFVSWMGLAGGLGGGIGTIHEQEGCRDVTYCLNSVKVQYVYMLSLGVALVLTLPVILYPSTEMLEIWLDERADEKRRKLEAEAEANNVPDYETMTTKQLKSIRRNILEAEAEAHNVPNPEKMTTKQLKAVRRHIRSKSLMDLDKAMKNLDTSSQEKNTTSPPPQADVYIEMKTVGESNGGPGTYTPPSVEKIDVKIPDPNSAEAEKQERKIKAKRKLKYWKLRMFLAALICIIGTLEGSFPQLVKAAEVIRGVGLSMAGLITPPLLYMSAVGGRFSAGMASAMALLIGLGLFNIVLVLMSAFGGKDYIIEEGAGHYHDSFYEFPE